MLSYYSIEELLSAAEETGKKISEVVIEDQVLSMEISREEIISDMTKNYDVMRGPFEKDKKGERRKSLTGLSGMNAGLMKKAIKEGRTIVGGFFSDVMANALTVAEHNAGMGKIVAAPTAGASGILPSVLVTMETYGKASREDIIYSIFTAGAIGMVIANKASISGAEGGCQAECGSAAAMAAAALVELSGGTPRQVVNAATLAIKSLMGLVCDPVCGLVEVPCVKRNSGSAAVAMAAAEMALAGIESVIPPDEVIDAMKAVGQALPVSLRETAEGGLAATPTARRLEKTILSVSEEPL